MMMLGLLYYYVKHQIPLHISINQEIYHCEWYYQSADYNQHDNPTCLSQIGGGRFPSDYGHFSSHASLSDSFYIRRFLTSDFQGKNGILAVTCIWNSYQHNLCVISPIHSFLPRVICLPSIGKHPLCAETDGQLSVNNLAIISLEG